MLALHVHVQRQMDIGIRRTRHHALVGGRLLDHLDFLELTSRRCRHRGRSFDGTIMASTRAMHGAEAMMAPADDSEVNDGQFFFTSIKCATFLFFFLGHWRMVYMDFIVRPIFFFNVQRAIVGHR